MALIVEDGTQVAGAQSYVSASTVTEYCTARLMTGFTGLSAAALEPAVLRAMRWLEGYYRTKWKGQKTNSSQALNWPRAYVDDENGYGIASNTIPQCVKDAVCEAADREAASAGSLGADLARGGAVQREAIGPIDISYFGGASPETTYPTIDRMLTHLVEASGRVLRG